jgi:putative transcriptional regulator
MENLTILELRKKTGLSQRKFAKKYHIGLRALQSWEQGWRDIPESTLYMIQRIIELEGASIDKQDYVNKWFLVDDCEKFIAKCPVCGKVVDSRMINKYPICPKCNTKMSD